VSQNPNNQVISLDSKCLNCQNNASGIDRSIIYQLFKIACLQYKPSPLQLQGRVYQRIEILQMKQQLVTDMEREIERSGKTHMGHQRMRIDIKTN
jgi:hypothetical protein